MLITRKDGFVTVSHSYRGHEMPTLRVRRDFYRAVAPVLFSLVAGWQAQVQNNNQEYERACLQG